MTAPGFVLVVWPSGVYEAISLDEYTLRYPDEEALRDSYASWLTRREYLELRHRAGRRRGWA